MNSRAGYRDKSRCPTALPAHGFLDLVCQRNRRHGSVSLTDALQTPNTPRLSTKTNGTSRSFMMRDPVGSGLLDRILSLVVCTKLRLHENPMERQHHKRSTSRWKQSRTSPSPRLESILLRAECQRGLPSSTRSSKHDAIEHRNCEAHETKPKLEPQG